MYFVPLWRLWLLLHTRRGRKRSLSQPEFQHRPRSRNQRWTIRWDKILLISYHYFLTLLLLKIVVRMYLKRTPNFQRQHYLYWCNVYNLSYGIREACRGTTIRVGCKDSTFLIRNLSSMIKK